MISLPTSPLFTFEALRQRKYAVSLNRCTNPIHHPKRRTPQVVRFTYICNQSNPKMDWYNYLNAVFLLASPVTRAEAEGWCILGEHFLSALSSRVRCSLPKMEECHNQYCHSYSRGQWQSGCIEFSTFWSKRDDTISEKDPKCFPGTFQRVFLFFDTLLLKIATPRPQQAHFWWRQNCPCHVYLIYLFKGTQWTGEQTPSLKSLTSSLSIPVAA